MSVDTFTRIKARIITVLIAWFGFLTVLYIGYRGKIHFSLSHPPQWSDFPSNPPWMDEYKRLVDNVVHLKNSDMEVFNKASHGCVDFYSNFGENVKVALEYMKNANVTTDILRMLQLDDAGISELTNKTNSSSYPVILSGISENHFREAEGLIKGIHENIRNNSYKLHLIVYDLGLSNASLEILERYCRCEVRKFPFEVYPFHIADLHRYSWKPILIQMVLQEFDYVMWMDASIRLTNISLFPLFQAARNRGIQIRRGGGSLAFRTHPDTFKWLKEDPCRFEAFPETPTGWLLIKRNLFVMSAVMRPWVKCALEPGCMSPLHYEIYFKCYQDRHFLDACHRFDQSVLGIILTRIFNYKISFVHFIHKSKYGKVQRQDAPWYFPRSTPYPFVDNKKPVIWSKTQKSTQ